MMSSIKVIAQVHKVNISSSFRFHAHIPPYLFGAYFFFAFFSTFQFIILSIFPPQCLLQIYIEKRVYFSSIVYFIFFNFLLAVYHSRIFFKWVYLLWWNWFCLCESEDKDRKMVLCVIATLIKRLSRFSFDYFFVLP